MNIKNNEELTVLIEKATAGHEKSLYGAPVAGETRCHLSSTHGRATSSPAASIMRMSSSTPMPCVVR